MNIKARFTCHSVTRTNYSEDVVLAPVVTDNENDPNQTYSEATPSGSLEMCITNRDAWGAFAPGKNYDLDITPSPVTED